MTDNTSLMTVLGTVEYGSPATSLLSFHQIEKPDPSSLSSNQVMIQVHYSELNPVDHHKIKGNGKLNKVPSEFSPLVVGYGGSGIVVASGMNDDSLLNQPVCFLVDSHPSKKGSFAEYIVCDKRLVTLIPKYRDCDSMIDMTHAATVPLSGCTAFESLQKVGLPISNIKDDSSDKTLLIVGGGGGVGSWCTQLARACYPNLNIICTASSTLSSEWCQKMGANKVIGHDDIESLGGGPKGSVDHIICLAEPTKETFNALAEVLRPFGKICLVVAGKGIQSLDLGFVFFKSGTVSTETIFSSVRAGYILDQDEEMKIMLELIASKRVNAPLSPNLEDRISLNPSCISWMEAVKEGGLIDLVGSGHCVGKLVMKIVSSS